MRSVRSYFYQVADAAGFIDVNAKLATAAKEGRTGAVRDLLETGADVHASGNAKGPRGDVALQFAAEGGHTATVKRCAPPGRPPTGHCISP